MNSLRFYKENFRILGRTAVKASALLLVMMLVLSVAPGISAQDEMSGTVSWYPQFYNAPDTRPEMSAAVEAVAQDYMDLRPGVSIELLPSREAAYNEWLGAMMAAGTAPDIAWYQWQDRNNETRDWWAPLNEYLLAPNPYIAEGELGSERWIDTMPDNVTNNMLAGDGNWYEIALDWIEIGLIYNAALIDGCSRLRRVFSIDLPNIRGPLALVAIINLNATLQAFGSMYSMTSGGPVNTTLSPVLFQDQRAILH